MNKIGTGMLVIVVSLAACAQAVIPTAPAPVEVTRQVVVTQLVEVTRQVMATQLVEVTRQVEVTKLVEVTQLVPVTVMPTITPPATNTPIPAAAWLTALGVIDKFNAAGLNVSDVHPTDRLANSPLPNTYREQVSFSIPEVAPNGGQVFVCATKRYCDALYAYFDALTGLTGPYLYQSPSGTVVVQLNSRLTPDTGAKFEAVVATLP